MILLSSQFFSLGLWSVSSLYLFVTQGTNHFKAWSCLGSAPTFCNNTLLLMLENVFFFRAIPSAFSVSEGFIIMSSLMNRIPWHALRAQFWSESPTGIDLFLISSSKIKKKIRLNNFYVQKHTCYNSHSYPCIIWTIRIKRFKFPHFVFHCTKWETKTCPNYVICYHLLIWFHSSNLPSFVLVVLFFFPLLVVTILSS